MSDLVKTIRIAVGDYIDVDLDKVAFEYTGDDHFYVQECTGKEWLEFDEDKRGSFSLITDGLFCTCGNPDFVAILQQKKQGAIN
jgi:hypothetical protein